MKCPIFIREHQGKKISDMRYYWHDIGYNFSAEGCQWMLGSPKVVSYPGIQVIMMMMMMTQSVSIGPDDV